MISISALGAVLGPIPAFFWPKHLELVPSSPVLLGEEGTIPLGESRTIRFGKDPAIVIHSEQVGLIAYSAVCTRFACIVNWNPQSGMIECPCHAGFYDPRDGSVISGPPPSPLASIRIAKEGGSLYLVPA